MSDSAPTFTLGSFACELYGIEDAAKLGAPQIAFDVLTGPLADDVGQGPAYVKDARQMNFALRLAGVASASETKRENCVRKLFNLEIELGKATNTLTIVRRDSTVATVYDVLGSAYPEAGFTVVWDRGGVMRVDVTLTVKSWAKGTVLLQNLCSAQATPSTVDVTVAGSVPTPLTLIAQRGFSGSGLQTLIAARVGASAVIGDMLMLAMSSSCPNWSAYTATSGYVTASDNARIVTSTTYRAMYWTALPVGRYALYAKCRVQTGGKGWLAQSRSSNDPSTASVAVTDTDWRFVRLGDYASDGYTALRIVGRCRESANGLLLDWVLAIPLTYGSPLYFHCTSLEVTNLSVPVTPLGSVLTTSAGVHRSARRYVSGSPIEAVGTCRLVIAACDAAGTLRQPSLTLSEQHTPRYVHWVPTTES